MLIKLYYFVCVPSHVGISDNEKADYAGKSALNLPHVTVGVPILILNISQ